MKNRTAMSPPARQRAIHVSRSAAATGAGPRALRVSGSGPSTSPDPECERPGQHYVINGQRAYKPDVPMQKDASLHRDDQERCGPIGAVPPKFADVEMSKPSRAGAMMSDMCMSHDGRQ